MNYVYSNVGYYRDYRMYMLFNKVVKQRLGLFGHVPLCNLRQGRAPVVFGFCSPLCYRCFGLVMGGLFVSLSPLVTLSLPGPVFALGLIFMPLDWSFQRWGILPSTNLRRFLSGFLFVLALNVLSYY